MPGSGLADVRADVHRTDPGVGHRAFDRSARRRNTEQDLAALSTAYAEVAQADMLEAAHGACELLHRLTADESAAWS